MNIETAREYTSKKHFTRLCFKRTLTPEYNEYRNRPRILPQ